MSVKDPAIIYLKYVGDQLVLTDNEGNGPSSSCDFETDVQSNGTVGWQLADNSGISSIDDIQVTSGEDIFKKLPYEKKGEWEAKIDKKSSGEATYDILYTPVGGSQQRFDPSLKVRPPAE